MLIDSHCHLDDYDDLPAILGQAEAAGVHALLAIGIGDGPATMHRALALAHEHTRPTLRVFASVGIHPQEAHQATAEALAHLHELATDTRCIAIGEIGLDYYHLDNPNPEVQQAAFVAQIQIAARLRKPITIHCRTSELASDKVKARFGQRDAWQDLLALLHEHWKPTGLHGIMHCFSGTEDQAARSLAAGFYLSFAGNVTYPRATALQAVARTVPPDRLLVETDAPFLTPQSRRGQTNQPAFVVETADFLAGLRGISTQQLAQHTTSNFGRLFPSTLRASTEIAS